VLVLQARADGRQLQPLAAIGHDLPLIGRHARGLLRGQLSGNSGGKLLLQVADAGQRSLQEVLLGGPAAVAADRAAIEADQRGDLAITGAVAHQAHDFLDIHRQGSPIGHGKRFSCGRQEKPADPSARTCARPLALPPARLLDQTPVVHFGREHPGALWPRLTSALSAAK